MEEKKVSIWKSTLMTGVYIGIVFILIGVIFYVTGNPFSKINQYLSYPLIIGGVIWAQVTYKKALGGTLTYGQAVAAGVITLVYAAVISGIYTYVLYKFIDPGLQEQLRQFTEEEIIKQGKVPEAQVEMAVNVAAKFQKPEIIFVLGIVGSAFISLIVGLITAIFTKKNPVDEVPA